MPTSLPRLLILPVLAALLALAVPASPASAGGDMCPCWPGGVPLAAPLVCYAAPGAQTNTFAYVPPFLQVTNFWCRNNASFAPTSAAQSAACDASLRCLCSNPAPGPEVLCNDNDDDCDPATPDCQTEFESEFQDPDFGVCIVAKQASVRFCDTEPCRACGDNQFEYIYRVTPQTSTDPTLALNQFSIPVPSSDVISAGFLQGNGTVAPSATNVDPSEVRWTFLSPLVQPGQTSEDLFICSFKGPDFGVATASCEFGVDAPGSGAPDNCLGPLVDCGLPGGPLSCPSGPFGPDTD